MVEGAHEVFGDSQIAVVLLEVVIFFCCPFDNGKREFGRRCPLGVLYLAHSLRDGHHSILSEELDDIIDRDTINEPIGVFAIVYARCLPTCDVVLCLVA